MCAKSNFVLEMEYMAEEMDLDRIYSSSECKKLRQEISDVVINKLFDEAETDDAYEYSYSLRWIQKCKYKRTLTAEIYQEKWKKNQVTNCRIVQNHFWGFVKVQDLTVSVYLLSDTFKLNKEEILS